MSDTNQEDLSVEDILSSIKNILTDETGNSIPDTDESVSPPVSTEDKPLEEQKQEDVFDLDSSMIIEEKNPEQTDSPSADTLNIEQTLEATDKADAGEISATDNTPQNDSEEAQPQNETTSPEPQQETTPQKPAEVREETIDASANIINNFAKVFAEKQQEQAKQEAAKIQETVEAEIKKTNITGMVQEAIVAQVKSSLETHFESIASELIANQTREWLDKNLAQIVENTVAKEIERVIAKVGS